MDNTDNTGFRREKKWSRDFSARADMMVLTEQGWNCVQEQQSEQIGVVRSIRAFKQWRRNR